MAGTTLAFLIVATVMMTAVIKEYLKTKGKEAESRAPGTDSESSARIQKLEERVKVLERIVTDKSTRLHEEINAL
tara:strand:- start:1557 stop:1781 length:225 start_codon:yes stop_codon:yes gene_type:complete